MKKVLFYLIAITITLSCKTKSDLSAEKYVSSQTEQKIQKSYGAGGKIIYGASEGSQNDSPSYTDESYVEDNHTPALEEEDNEQTQEKNKVKNRNKKSFGFDALKIRHFSKNAEKTSKEPTDNGTKSKADKRAISGFTFFILTLITIGLAFFFGSALGYFGFLVFGLALIFPILSIIFSIGGLKSERFKTLAIIGLILSPILVIYVFTLYF